MTHIPLGDAGPDECPVLRRRASDQSHVSRSLGIATLVVGLMVSIFMAGYNWRQVTEVAAKEDQFVRKDVDEKELQNVRDSQNQQFRNVSDRLQEISKQLEDMRRELTPRLRRD